MNAFRNTRLAPGSASAAASASAATARPVQPAVSSQHPKNLSASTARSGQKRLRDEDDEQSTATAQPARTKHRSTDALFAPESDEDEEDGDEEEEEHAQDDEQVRLFKSKKSNAAARSNSTHRTSTAAASSDPSFNSRDSSTQPPRKKSRSAPEELSISKRPVASAVIVTALPKFNIEKKRRDPRFDPLCGDYSTQHFSSHYSWMTDAKKEEIAGWQAELKKGSRGGQPLSQEERQELQANIQRAKQSIAAATREKGESSLLGEWKKNERAAQKDGKKPFFLKKSEQKKLALAARYLELKSSKGALQKFMVKKTKDIKNKDHTYMPRQA